MFFLSMKIHDNNNEIPLMSEHSDNVAFLVKQAEDLFELLTRDKQWDRAVIDNNFEKKRMSDAGMDLINKEILDFEWKFPDKYNRIVKCYMTRNV